MSPFNYSVVREWAERHPLGATLGIPRDVTCCPFAAFLMYQNAGTEPSVYYVGDRVFGTFREGREGLTPLPWWVRMAVLLIDLEKEPIIRERFLEILEMVMRNEAQVGEMHAV